MSKYQTEQRQKILEAFKNNEHNSFSAQDILKKCGNDDISISAIYRNLKIMEEEGLICKVVDNKKSEALYHYVKPDVCFGVIHLKCETCEKTYHLNKHISNMLINIAKDELDFNVSESSAFLFGKCDNCSQIKA